MKRYKNKQKRFTLKYTIKEQSALTFIGSLQELESFLNSVGKNATVETKISDDMPVLWHNKIADHNKNLETTNSE